MSELSVDDKDGTIDIELVKNANYSFELSNRKYDVVQKKVETAKKNKTNGEKTNKNAKITDLPDLPNI